MDSTLSSRSYNKRRKGQTLVEFALTLPILMLMIFGIIEFGRIFQAWVSLQNAARAAARFASTGAVNYDIFTVTATDGPLDIRVLNEFVPCDVNDNNGADIYADTGAPADGANGVQIYEGVDGLFATWYDGTDCDPTLEDHTTLRKDMLRIASIMFEARESVNALSAEGRVVGTEETHYFKDLTPADFKGLLQNVFATELPRYDQRGWFDIQMCSSRGLLDPVAPTNDLSRTLNQDLPLSRFVTVRGAADLAGLPDGYPAPPYDFPYCMLNEVPPPPAAEGGSTTAVDNSGVRWMDAGGAGDRVTIFVTFNHPLITPLRMDEQNFLTMQSRRSIVNESFRAPKAIGAFQRSLPPGSGGVGTLAPSLTPSHTFTPSLTPTNTKSPTPTPTDTPEPFSCDNLSAVWASPPFEANRMFLLIGNGNYDQTELLKVVISWGDLANPHQDMYLGAMSMYGDVHWAGGAAGNNNTVPNQTSVDTGNLSQGYRIITAQSEAIWEAIFFAGPSTLSDYMSLYDFSAQFTFDFPGSPEDCVITLVNPPGGEPTEPIDPTVGPSPTNTPNCATATNQINLKFGGFGSFGGVYLVLTNNSGRDLVMTGFDFVWPDDSHPAINEPAGGYRLAAVKLGGDDVLTSPQTLWTAAPPAVNNGNTALGPPYNNRTLSGAVGTWQTNGTLPAGSTNIWMDFDSVPGSMYDFNARPWHFDTSKIKIACYGSGGSGGGGGDSDEGDVDVPVPSPTITKTPKPTNTAGPTNTTGPATKTWTATQPKTLPPPTLTYTPPAATFTPSKTPIGQPTSDDGGGGE